MADDEKSDDELTGVTLAHAIEHHGPESCGEVNCKVEAARRFVDKAKMTARPWDEVLALHVRTSLVTDAIMEAEEEHRAYRNHFGLFLFDLVDRMGGVVFVPPFHTIEERPGRVSIEATPDGGHVFKLIKTSKKRVH